MNVTIPSPFFVLALPILPLLILTAVVAVVAVASLLPGERLRQHVRQLIPLLTTAIRATRTRPAAAHAAARGPRLRRAQSTRKPP